MSHCLAVGAPAELIRPSRGSHVVLPFQCLCSVAHGRLAVRNLLHRLLQVVVVLFTKLGHPVLAVKSLPDDFVCLDELVDLASEFVVLVGDDADVIVHGVDLDLEVGVVLEQGVVRVPGTLQFLSHVQQLVLLLSDLHL